MTALPSRRFATTAARLLALSAAAVFVAGCTATANRSDTPRRGLTTAPASAPNAPSAATDPTETPSRHTAIPISSIPPQTSTTATGAPTSVATTGAAGTAGTTRSRGRVAAPTTHHSSGPAVETGFSKPAVEPSHVVTKPHGSTSVTILAGPTLQNDYPRTWGFIETLPPDPARQCAEVTNSGVGLPVRLHVAIVNSGSTADADKFSLWDPSSADFSDSLTPVWDCYLGSTFTLTQPASCRSGVTLPAATSGQPPACLLGIQTSAAAGTDAEAALRYELQVTCTAKLVSPCTEASVVDPSPSHPVLVSWTHQVKLQACFAAVPTIADCPARHA
ncbi:hypothetical protein SAMN05444157_1453 [Frankineae bacterium MT45]|nr:hypothetical protein SAMN05444157_1453 [Frankineae bacterium MT45]